MVQRADAGHSFVVELELRPEAFLDPFHCAAQRRLFSDL